MIVADMTRKSFMKSFAQHHILSTNSFTLDDLNILFTLTQKMEQRVKKHRSLSLLNGYILATLFFEPSTRTRLSFETAMLRLGGQVITVEHGESSSLKKGETLEDMGYVVGQYADCVVMRHPDPYSVDRLASTCQVPVINAGDGANQHPTQALLDLYTIYSEKKRVNGLHIGIMGDLKYGRTVHSLVDLLQEYSVQLTFISHPSLKLPEKSIASLRNKGLIVKESESLESVIPNLDVLYVTRVQEERFQNRIDYEKVKNLYQITPSLLRLSKDALSILHPLPRTAEIHPEVDTDPKARYFKQVQNGIYLRMALLSLLLGGARDLADA